MVVACGLYDPDDRMNLAIYSGRGDIEKVKEYIPKVSTLNYRSVKGETPLNSAAYNGHLEVVKILIHEGASCLYEDEYGKTAYETAVEQDQVEVQKYLLSIGECTSQ